MVSILAAVEITGTVDEQHRLMLDGELPIPGPKRVRVLILYPVDDEWDEEEWLAAAAGNPAFDYLHDPAEDIYHAEDGEPFGVADTPPNPKPSSG